MSAMRGAALVLVLWLIALLTAMIGAFALTARVEALQGSMLRNGAQAQEYARSGLEYALSRLQSTDTQARWLADGRRYRWQMDDATVEIRITDESGKVDLNMAEPALLAGLVRAVGAEQGRDTRIAGAIVDWRDGDSLSQPGVAQKIAITPMPDCRTVPRMARSKRWASCAWCWAWMASCIASCCPTSPCTAVARVPGALCARAGADRDGPGCAATAGPA